MYIIHPHYVCMYMYVFVQFDTEQDAIHWFETIKGLGTK
jgi:hypothetical protein